MLMLWQTATKNDCVETLKKCLCSVFSLMWWGRLIWSLSTCCSQLLFIDLIYSDLSGDGWTPVVSGRARSCRHPDAVTHPAEKTVFNPEIRSNLTSCVLMMTSCLPVLHSDEVQSVRTNVLSVLPWWAPPVPLQPRLQRWRAGLAWTGEWCRSTDLSCVETVFVKHETQPTDQWSSVMKCF